LTQSWKNFFQDKSGQIGKPRFHSRKYLKKSYTGYVKTSKTGVLQNTKIKRYTVLLETTGKYYLSLQVEISEPEKYSLTGKRVGIDVGVADLAILSNGLKYPSF
ncbi:transposase, partial [Lactobacillus helveticus]